jgi:hypothetical protein
MDVAELLKGVEDKDTRALRRAQAANARRTAATAALAAANISVGGLVTVGTTGYPRDYTVRSALQLLLPRRSLAWLLPALTPASSRSVTAVFSASSCGSSSSVSSGTASASAAASALAETLVRASLRYYRYPPHSLPPGHPVSAAYARHRERTALIEASSARDADALAVRKHAAAARAASANAAVAAAEASGRGRGAAAAYAAAAAAALVGGPGVGGGGDLNTSRTGLVALAGPGTGPGVGVNAADGAEAWWAGAAGQPADPTLVRAAELRWAEWERALRAVAALFTKGRIERFYVLSAYTTWVFVNGSSSSSGTEPNEHGAAPRPVSHAPASPLCPVALASHSTPELRAALARAGVRYFTPLAPAAAPTALGTSAGSLLAVAGAASVAALLSHLYADAPRAQPAPAPPRAAALSNATPAPAAAGAPPGPSAGAQLAALAATGATGVTASPALAGAGAGTGGRGRGGHGGYPMGALDVPVIASVTEFPGASACDAAVARWGPDPWAGAGASAGASAGVSTFGGGWVELAADPLLPETAAAAVRAVSLACELRRIMEAAAADADADAEEYGEASFPGGKATAVPAAVEIEARADPHPMLVTSVNLNAVPLPQLLSRPLTAHIDAPAAAAAEAAAGALSAAADLAGVMGAAQAEAALTAAATHAERAGRRSARLWHSQSLEASAGPLVGGLAAHEITPRVRSVRVASNADVVTVKLQLV